MAYMPSFEDIPDTGYMPSIEDIPAQEQTQEAAQPMSLVDRAKGIAANVAAGGIDSALSILRKIPSPADWEPERTQQFQMMQKTGERPIDKFDPYKALGTKEEPITSEAGIEQFLGSVISPGAMAAKPVARLASFFRKIEPVKLIKKLQKAHDLKMAENSNLFNRVANQAESRGVSNVQIPSNVFDQAAEHLPKTKRMENLINNAKGGNYQALHDFQSLLGQKGTRWMKSGNKADENAAEILLDSRKSINDAIESHFNNTGNSDLAEMLSNARAGWKNLKQTYYQYSPIKRIVHKEIKKVPKNPWNLLLEDSEPVRKLMNEHPEIAREVALHALRKEMGANKALRGVMYGIRKGGGLAGGGLLAGLGFEGGRKLTHYYDE